MSVFCFTECIFAVYSVRLYVQINPLACGYDGTQSRYFNPPVVLRCLLLLLLSILLTLSLLLLPHRTLGHTLPGTQGLRYRIRY